MNRGQQQTAGTGSKRRQAAYEEPTTQPKEGERSHFIGQPICLAKGQKLQPHQIDSLKWMGSLHANNLNGILADDMGMGKTIQAIAFLAYLYESCGVRQCPHLIVAPKSTISNWLREFKLWAPFLRVVNLIPTAEYREEILST